MRSAPASILCILCCAGLLGCGGSQPRVVLYCAQDREFAEGILAEFTRRTGIRVDCKFDTEADKSVSLYAELVQEQSQPRCDVHWNNEILATLRLQRQGVLAEYASPSAKPFPAFARDRLGQWTAFAARARVLIVNTELVPQADRPHSILDLAAPRWKGKTAMAKPLFGTTATQAACLFQAMGPDKARAYYQSLRENQIHIVPGNKQVAEGVANGLYAFGITDTDDACQEIAAGKPVAMVFPDGDGADGLGSLVLPNTLALIRGAPNPAAGKKLIDFLLSAEIEKQLAESASHQIPLNPEVTATFPDFMRPATSLRMMKVDLERAADGWEEAQTCLRNLFAMP